MSTLDDLKELGYELDYAMTTEENVEIYRVSGPGVVTYVGEDEDATIKSLVDSHDERVKQEEEGYVSEAAHEAQQQEEESAEAPQTGEDPSDKE